VPLLPSKAPFSNRFEAPCDRHVKALGTISVAAHGTGGGHRAGDGSALSGALGGDAAGGSVATQHPGLLPYGDATGQLPATLTFDNSTGFNGGPRLQIDLTLSIG